MMLIKNLLLILISSLIIISSILLISSTHPVHAIIYLILIFFHSTGLLLIEQLEFMGFILILIYVGAIAVLFLFVIMLLNIKVFELNILLSRYIPIGVFIATLFFVELLFLYNSIIGSVALPFSPTVASFYMNLFYVPSNIELLGFSLYGYKQTYLFLIAYILLLAMIGAIKLTLVTRKSKKQDVYQQVSRKLAIKLFTSK